MRVELWRGCISERRESLAELSRTLSPREIERSRRVVDPARLRAYIVTQAALRRVLAAVTSADPADIEFSYGWRGKPYLKFPDAALWFNMSHSHDIVGVAVSRDGEIGLDIERARRLVNADRVAERFFTDEERSGIASAGPGEKDLLVVQAWTRYEARIKQIGGNMWHREDARGAAIVTTDVQVAEGYGCSVAAAARADVTLREIGDLFAE